MNFMYLPSFTSYNDARAPRIQAKVLVILDCRWFQPTISKEGLSIKCQCFCFVIDRYIRGREVAKGLLRLLFTCFSYSGLQSAWVDQVLTKNSHVGKLCYKSILSHMRLICKVFQFICDQNTKLQKVAQATLHFAKVAF